LRRYAAPALLLAPALLVFLGLFVWPQLGLFATSLSKPPPIGTAHYQRFLGDGFYLAMLGRTLFLGACVTLVCLVAGLPLALWLARLESRWVPLLLIIVSFPLWVSAVVRSFGWMVLFLRNGLLSSMLRDLGLAPSGFQLMFTLGAVVIALAQVLLPLMVITLYAVFRSIERDLEAAAMNLGASPAGAVWFVTLPLARGGILAGSLIVFSLSISAFATPSLVGGARAQLMAVAIYEQTLELLDWPFAAAIAAILLAIALTVALIYGRLLDPAQRLEAARR
jgi:putative spermidine/putrescine transport system permease protein